MMGPNAFERSLSAFVSGHLRCLEIKVLQVNLGLLCNQQCRHCHVQASPRRTESMAWPTMARIAEVARDARCQLVDLTGGAPELNRHFRRFVTALRAAGLGVQVRTNLTVHLIPGMEDLGEFLRDQQVRLVASLPCYLAENVDAQRGPGVHQRSIDVLRRLNTLGYGAPDGLPLNLIYNPTGAYLPPGQAALEADYRRELRQRHGVDFTRLLTIANMPIGRFLADLRKTGQDRAYMATLVSLFNARTLDRLMCRHQLSIGWDGTLYDCDFNLALGVPVDHGAPDRLANFAAADLSRRRITTGDHCFGCTAGCGSSCGGALTEPGDP